MFHCPHCLSAAAGLDLFEGDILYHQVRASFASHPDPVTSARKRLVLSAENAALAVYTSSRFRLFGSCRFIFCYSRSQVYVDIPCVSMVTAHLQGCVQIRGSRDVVEEHFRERRCRKTVGTGDVFDVFSVCEC